MGFYCIPVLTGLSIGAPLAAIVALSIYTSVYIAEIFRAGINSIEKGQVDVARALGMSHFQTMRRIVLPQAIRRMIPPMMNQFSALIKYSSLASYLAIYELFKEITNLSLMVFRPLEIYTTAAFVYFIPIFLCRWLHENSRRFSNGRAKRSAFEVRKAIDGVHLAVQNSI